MAQVTAKQVVQYDALEDVLARVLGAVYQDIAVLEARVARAEAAVELPKFIPWQAGQTYKCGSIVSIPAAGIYRALADTQAHPSNSSFWQLILKAGRDGKDGKDATSQEQRTVQSERSSQNTTLVRRRP